MEILRLRFANGDPAGPLRQAAHDRLNGLAGTNADAVEDVLLVISELVQNVTQHTRSDGVLSIDLVEDDVLIQVADSDPTPPRPQTPDGHRIGGRGLLLVAALTAAWGVQRTGEGKVVWARLPVPQYANLLIPA